MVLIQLISKFKFNINFVLLLKLKIDLLLKCHYQQTAVKQQYIEKIADDMKFKME
jgi:hypothetical protein